MSNTAATYITPASTSPSNDAFLQVTSEICRENDYISPRLFDEYGVNLGLRDDKGRGILTGLTSISKITSKKVVAGKTVPDEGKLWYRGRPIQDLIASFGDELGFEKVAYLLLTGDSENSVNARQFTQILGESRALPPSFVRDVIMDNPTHDIMNSMTKSILALGTYDENAADTSIPAVLSQCIHIIGQMPRLAVYAYYAYLHYANLQSMYLHNPLPELSTAENLLRMLRPDMSYTPLEAKVLDTALILHMEHGGGNNSTFTTRVVTSSGSDTYSTIAAAMSSLKGPRHGGASIKTLQMMDEIKANVKDWNDDEEIAAYLAKILNKEAFDHKGLVYGMGHAVYTLSDPREKVLSGVVGDLAREKGREDELHLYQAIERIAPDLISAKRRNGKPVCSNIDFYSGFVYDMLGIPRELLVPMFAIARVVGWSAHRIEELTSSGKIIRPAYMSVME
ncbi:MAG: citrate synthase [Eggerthellaceae bacterium]